MAKKLKTLAKELEFEKPEEYYDYIIMSKVNGQKHQVIELFNQMKKDDKLFFLNEYLEPNPIENEVKRICIEQILI